MFACDEGIQMSHGLVDVDDDWAIPMLGLGDLVVLVDIPSAENTPMS